MSKGYDALCPVIVPPAGDLSTGSSNDFNKLIFNKLVFVILVY